MKTYEFHPLCTLLPEPSAQEFADLKADILQNGLIDPIILLEDKILDGRSRYTACTELGVEPTFVEFGTLGIKSPVFYIVSKNLKRRHLSTEQRGITAAKLIAMSEGGMTKATAAKAMNVSEGTVTRSKNVVANAIPEVVKEVESGNLPVTAAERIAKKPTTEQKAALAAEKAKVEASRKKAADTKRAQAATQAATTSADKAIQTYTDCNVLCKAGQYDGKKLRKDIAKLQTAVDDLVHVDAVITDVADAALAFHNLGIAIDVLETHVGIPVDSLKKNRLAKQNLYNASVQKYVAMRQFMDMFPQTADLMLTACSTTDEQELINGIKVKFEEQKKRADSAFATALATTRPAIAKGEMVAPAEWYTVTVQ